MKKLFVLFIISALSINMLSAEDGIDIFDQDRELLPSKDTLLISRYQGDWYFGLIGGPQFDIYFGELHIPEWEGIFDQGYTKDYDIGSGEGYNIGFYSEWVPLNSRWGAALTFYLQDKIKSVAYTDIEEETLKTRYQSQLNLTYLTLSPSVKYRNLLWKNLFAMAGFDIMLPIDGELYQKKKFENTAAIDYDRSIQIANSKIRLSANIGIGYDIRLYSFYSVSSIFLTPFIMLKTSSNILTDYNSKWYSFQTRAGFALKWGMDRKKEELLAFNPDYVENPKAYAELTQKERGVKFLTGHRTQIHDAYDLDVDTASKPFADEKITDAGIGTKVDANPTPVVDKKLVPKFNKPDISFVKKSDDKNIENDLYSKLDAYIDFLKKNPYAEIRVISHSDDTGTKLQNKQRAQARLDKVVNYLKQKGIQEGRILPWNRSDMQPLHAGGRKNAHENRRIELIVQQ